MISLEKPNKWTSFLALWAASGSSYFAFWPMQVALALFAQHLTRSPLLVSGVTFALIVPALVFILLAGTIVDRIDRRCLLLGITLFRYISYLVYLFPLKSLSNSFRDYSDA